MWVSDLKNSVNVATRSVGMLSYPRASKSNRMMCATFNCNTCTAIVSCFSSINDSDETDITSFSNKLFSHVRRVPKHNVLIIGGDMYVYISKSEKDNSQNSHKRNDKYLAEFSLENLPVYLNTTLKKEGKSMDLSLPK